MDFDFALFLVIAVAVTGALWLYDLVALAPKRRAGLAKAAQEFAGEVPDNVAQKLRQEPAVIEYSKSFFPVLFLVLVLRSFLVEPFQIPSGSMLPTLKIGDFILVNKFHYGIRLPVVGTKVVAINEPKRGDVMVFRYPENPRIHYIKRVIGLPGDVVRYENKMLTINGQAVPQQFIEKYVNRSPAILASETLGKVEHQIYKSVAQPRQPGQWTVPEGHYFMMGDNRDFSNDSRFWGFVPDEYVVGKAFAVWMHWESWSSFPSFSNNGMIK